MISIILKLRELMKYYLIPIFAMFFLIGCAPKPVVQMEVEIEEEVLLHPLSSKLMKEYGLSYESLYRVQFYTSHDIVLYRTTSINKAKILDGKLVADKSVKTSEIIIKAGTPCVLKRNINNRLLVSFNDNYELVFTNPRRCSKDEGLFLLSANKWCNNIGTIKINGITYQAIGSSFESYLMINKEELDNSSSRSLVLDGKTLENIIEVNEI